MGRACNASPIRSLQDNKAVIGSAVLARAMRDRATKSAGKGAQFNDTDEAGMKIDVVTLRRRKISTRGRCCFIISKL